jgi:hypothetical protein
MRELPPFGPRTDTRDVLAAATRQGAAHADWFVCDIDAHVSEDQYWPEIIALVEDDVLRALGQGQLASAFAGPNALLNVSPGLSLQSVGGRIAHQGRQDPIEDGAGHGFVQRIRRAMDAMGIDCQVVFPSAMLLLGMHPQEEVEVALARAFNRWMQQAILPEEERLKGFLYLPFNTPEACERIVREGAADPNIIGFTVCSTRNKPVHHNAYMRLYAMIEESGKPLAFHSGYHWADPSFSQLNRFISMHALSFVHYNLIHLTNWIVNALPERFPRLKLLWVESGLAWIPFLMQRLDHEVMMRPSEAPGLKRKPSEYIREMHFTSQPLERTDMALLEATMRAMRAETQLLFSSDWPHWDWDPPSAVTSLPFLSEQAKRNILGLNAARLFGIEPRRRRPE